MITVQSDVSIIGAVNSVQNNDILETSEIFDETVSQELDVSVLDESESIDVDIASIDVDGAENCNNGAIVNHESVGNVTNNMNEVKGLKQNYQNNLIIGHLNVNSLRWKFNELSYLLVESRFEVMVLSETKLDSSQRDALYEIPDYALYRQDKRSNSGGLIIYVSKNIPSTKGRIGLINDDIEYMSVELNCKGNNILIVGIYKNPKMKPDEFKRCFKKLCEEIFDTHEHVIIIGDLNFNMLQTNTLSQMCPILNLTNIINEPTCFKSNNATLIDVMLVTKRRKFIKGFSIDTGISDFHNLIGGILRQHTPIPARKIIQYRKLSDIDYHEVNQELMEANLAIMTMNEINGDSAFTKLHNTLISILDKHAPKKQKTIKRNDFHCMSKRLKKAILKRNQLRNKFFKYRSSHFLALYRKQRNEVTLLKREEIKKYFKEKCKGSTKNKDFWKTIKPIFSRSKTKNDNIPLQEGNRLVTDCLEACQIFNKFFSEIGSDIGSPENNQRPIEDIIDSYENHSSIRMIRNKINHSLANVEFREVSENEVRKAIKNLSTKKAAGYDEIPIKFIKMTSRQLTGPVTIIVNKCIQQNLFPECMKLANITPIYKKKDKLNKDNYRSVNLLIALSKIFEKLLSDQMCEHMKALFHSYLSGFRKAHGCQDILTRLTEDWRQALDNGDSIGVVAIDLSKAFDCMPHGLLLAKLHAYGLSINACLLLKSYLVNRKQRVKIGNTYSDWIFNIKGVPQGSILGPLLFNVFINDFLYYDLNAKVYNYADDNTLSYSDSNVNDIKLKLEADCIKAMEWFQDNNMKANADKFQLMILNRHESNADHCVTIGNSIIHATPSITILGIEFDNKLKFEKYVTEVCNQTGKQINALKRIRNYLDKPCKTVIYNSYISSNFNYCPVVWMFANKTNMEKLEKINKRALRFVVNNDEANYEDICKNEEILNINRRCIKSAAIQMFKIKMQTAPQYLQELFTRRESRYERRDTDLFNIPRFKTINYGKKSFRYYGAKVWSAIPRDIKEINSLQNFKSALTRWLLNTENISSIEYL